MRSLWWHYSHVRSEWSLLEVRKNQTVRAKSSEFMTCLDYDPIMKDHLHLMQLHLAWHIWCEHTIGFTVCVSEVGLASNSVWAVIYSNIWDTDFYHQVFYYLSSVFFSRHYLVNSMSTHSLLCHCQTRQTCFRAPAWQLDFLSRNDVLIVLITVFINIINHHFINERATVHPCIEMDRQQSSSKQLRPRVTSSARSLTRQSLDVGQ